MSKTASGRFSPAPCATGDAFAPEKPESKKSFAPFGFRAGQVRSRYLRDLRIAEMFDAGKRIVEISKAEKLTPTWISTILHTTGVRAKANRGPGIPLGEIPEIIRLNASGVSLRAVGKRYGVSGEAIRQTIANWLKRKKKAAIAKRRASARTARAAEKVPRLSETAEFPASGALPTQRRLGPSRPRRPRAGRGMIGADLIDRLSERRNMSLRRATPLVAAFFECLVGALRRGERVEIRGFGVFMVRNYKGYRGRNPRTGQTVEVKPRRVAFFKPSRMFLKRMNAGRVREQGEADEVLARA